MQQNAAPATRWYVLIAVLRFTEIEIHSLAWPNLSHNGGLHFGKKLKMRKIFQHIFRMTPQFGVNELNLEILIIVFGAKLM